MLLLMLWCSWWCSLSARTLRGKRTHRKIRYISERRLPLQLFADHYDERKEVMLKHTPSLWEYRRRLGEDKDEMLLSVFTTWELSFQRIGKNEDERTMIGHFLTLSAFLDSTNIGEDLFRSHLASTDKPPR